MEDRIMSPDKFADDENIRPETLDDYIGQRAVTENIKVFIKSCTVIWPTRTW